MIRTISILLIFFSGLTEGLGQLDFSPCVQNTSFNILLEEMNAGQLSKADFIDAYYDILNNCPDWLDRQDSSRLSILNWIGQSLSDIEQFKEAIDRSVLSNIYTKLSNEYCLLGEYDMAIALLEKGLPIYKKDLEPRNPRISMVYNNLSKNHLKLLNHEKAIENAFFSMENLDWKFGDDPLKALHPKHLLDAIINYADAELVAYNITKDTSALHNSVAGGKLGLYLLVHLRSRTSDYTTGVELRNKVQDFLRNQLDAVTKLLLYNPDHSAFSHAFRIMEFSRNFDLFLEMNKYVALDQFEHIPEVFKIDSLENLLEKRIKETHQNVLDELSFSREFEEIRTAIRSLQVDLAAAYPEYFDIKYQQHIRSIREVENRLDEQSAVLDYFMGKKYLYVMLIRHDGSELTRLNGAGQLDSLISIFLKQTTAYFKGIDRSNDLLKSAASQWCNASHEIYRIVFEPLETKLEGVKTIKVVGDRSLSYVPFESLISAIPEEPTAFKSHAYLVRNYNFSYQYSASFQVNKKSENPLKNSVLAFAPDFKNVHLSFREISRKYGNLEHAKTEIQAIQSLMPAMVYLDNNAIKRSFLKQADQYKFIHLATHGIANAIEEEQSRIIFQPEFYNSYELSLGEIYNMTIPADVVVLSACETGVVDMQKGEGVFSLARGFVYAGAQSVVSSLWQMSAKSSSLFFTTLYERLLKKEKRSGALANTKRDFLKKVKTDLEAHPFYWSAFVLSGDHDELELDTKLPLWLIGIIVLGSVLLTYIVYKFAKPNKS